MGQIQNRKAYQKAAQKDAELTQKIIPKVDNYLEEMGLTSSCSDTDSIQLELLDLYLIQLEFRSEINRGTGQQRMWKNAQRKRHTSTIIGYRESIASDSFYKIEFYSLIDNQHWCWENKLYDFTGIAKAFCFEIDRLIRYDNLLKGLADDAG